MSCSLELTNHVPGILHRLPSTCLFSAPWVGRRLEPRNSSPQLFEILGWILVVAGSCLPVIFSSLELTDSLLTLSSGISRFTMCAVQCNSERLGTGYFGESFHSMGTKYKLVL
jgi:hypothetical protein